MAEIVVAVASKVAEFLVAPVGRQCCYVISSDRYVRQLKDELEKLGAEMVGVQHSINEARNNVKPIEAKVENWMKETETVANKARHVLEKDRSDKKTRFCGWLRNPKERYCLGKDARETIEAIQALISRVNNLGRVCYESAPPGSVAGTPNTNSSAVDRGAPDMNSSAVDRFAPDVNSSAADRGAPKVNSSAVDRFAPNVNTSAVDRFAPAVDRGAPNVNSPAVDRGAPDVNSSAVDRGDTFFGSRASILEDIMEALKNKELKVIGVYGPGGMGKTTLLKEVETRLRKERRPFNMIVKAEVSQKPDLYNIQNQIADGLSLDLRNKQSLQGRRDLLFNRLQEDPNEKVLIILDDLWTELDLEAIGISSGDKSSKCKLLLTSRFKNVLEEMRANKTFPLDGLNDDEAFRLLEKEVGDGLKDDKVREIAAQLLKKLGGLPLWITSVAIPLKGKRLYAWKEALEKIDKEKKMETIVKWGYDQLESEDTKSLFLLCGLIGGTIRVELLLGLGMGLGLFKVPDGTMVDSRDKLNDMLHSLRSVRLLQDGGDDEEYVTIHDVYSEVAVSTPFGGQNSLIMNSNCDSWRKEELEKCWAMCHFNVGCDRLAELMRGQFPNLKMLMLSQPAHWNGQPTHRHYEGSCCRLDFTYMKKLQVLYLRSMGITHLPSSIEILGNLRSLYLDHCLVEDVAILGKLKALQILSCEGSWISRLPKEIGELTNLISLNLNYCDYLMIIEPGALKGLINLEELYMRDRLDQRKHKFDPPKEFTDEFKSNCNAWLAELKSLTKLTSLEIRIVDPTILLEDGDLPFGNLIRFWIPIGNFHSREFKGLNTMNLKLKGCDSILSREWIQKTLCKTQFLHLGELPESKKNVHELCAEGFSKLKALSVTRCNQLENLWSLSQEQRLAQLEEIEVWECESMRAIVIDDVGKDRVELPNLRRLDLCVLPEMTSFCIGAGITSKDAPTQAMIADEEGKDEGTDDTIEELPMRCRLTEKFFSRPHGKKELVTATSDSQNTYSDSFFDPKVSLPSLEELKLTCARSLKRIWHDPLPGSSFYKLTTLTLHNCSCLLDVFPSTIIRRMHNLKEVSVSKCDSLKSVFDCGSLNSYTEQTTVLLPHLESVWVVECDSLESLFDCGSFASNTEQKFVLHPKLEEGEMENSSRLSHASKSDSQTVVGFPYLKSVTIQRCPKLRYFFSNNMATTLGKLEHPDIRGYEQMKEVVSKGAGGQSKEEVMSFPCLGKLTILDCPNFGAFIPSPTSVKRQLGETPEENDESPQSFFNEMVTFPNLRSLWIRDSPCKELLSNQIPTDSFCKLEQLLLEHCNNLQRIAPSHMWKRLQCALEVLKVESCRSIEIIYKSDGTDTKIGKLRCIYLFDLENLRYIWQDNGLPNILFPNLRTIRACGCLRLEILFPTFTAKFLGQISELEVEDCENIELIAGHGECEEATGTTITFSELTVLSLENLPKFKGYLPEKYSVEIPLKEKFAEWEKLTEWEKFTERQKLANFPLKKKLYVSRCGTEPDQDSRDFFPYH